MENRHEINKFTKEYSPWARDNLAKEIKIIRSTRESDPDFKKKIQELRDNFYIRFHNQKTDFEENTKERDVREIAEKENVIFIHTIPTPGINRRNTSDNNQAIYLEDSNVSSLIDNIARQKPDLSCSSIYFGRKIFDVEKDKVTTMYPFGLVIGSGTVLSAYRYDAGTITEKDRSHKKSKYDPEVSDTSIQPDISRKINNVINRSFDRYKNPETEFYDGFLNRETGEIETREIVENDDYRGSIACGYYDEFIISQPEIDGLYIDLDKLRGMQSYEAKMGVAQVLDQYKNVPIYVKDENEVYVYTRDDEGVLKLVDGIDLFQKLKTLG